MARPGTMSDFDVNKIFDDKFVDKLMAVASWKYDLQFWVNKSLKYTWMGVTLLVTTERVITFVITKYPNSILVTDVGDS